MVISAFERVQPCMSSNTIGPSIISHHKCCIAKQTTGSSWPSYNTTSSWSILSPIIGGGGFDISVENQNFIPPWMISHGARAAQTQNYSTIQPILAYTISHCRTSQKFCIILLITSIHNEDPKFQPNAVLSAGFPWFSLHLDVSPSISTHSIALSQVGLVAGRHWPENEISLREC